MYILPKGFQSALIDTDEKLFENLKDGKIRDFFYFATADLDYWNNKSLDFKNKVINLLKNSDNDKISNIFDEKLITINIFSKNNFQSAILNNLRCIPYQNNVNPNKKFEVSEEVYGVLFNNDPINHLRNHHIKELEILVNISPRYSKIINDSLTNINEDSINDDNLGLLLKLGYEIGNKKLVEHCIDYVQKKTNFRVQLNEQDGDYSFIFKARSKYDPDCTVEESNDPNFEIKQTELSKYLMLIQPHTLILSDVYSRGHRLGNLENLKNLTLNSLASFENCKKLENIHLISPISLKIKNFPNLKKITSEKFLNSSHSPNKISVKNCPQFETINLSAWTLSLFNCPKIIHLNNSNIFELRVVDLKNLQTIDLNSIRAKIINCSQLKTLNLSYGSELICADNLSLEELIIPMAEKLILINNPKIKMIDCLEKIYESLNLKELPNLSNRMKEKIETLDKFEIDPLSFQKSGQIQELPLPELIPTPQISFIDVKNEIDALSRIINEIMHDESIKEFIFGGQRFPKEGIQKGLENIVSLLNQNRNDEAVKRILFCFQKIMQTINTTQTLLINEKNQQEAEILKNKFYSIIIRMAISGVINDVDEMEKNFHLLYRLNELEESFNAINFNRDFDPEGIYLETHKKSVDEVRISLMDLFKKIRIRTPQIGTPPEHKKDEFNAFYSRVEQLVQLDAINIGQIEDREEIARNLIDIGLTNFFCGDRWISDLNQIYNLSKPKDQERKGDIHPLIEYIYNEDSNLKIGILEKLSFSNTHYFNQYKRLIGEEYGIPDSKGLEEFEDIHAAHITKEIAKTEFQKHYTVASILEVQRNFFKDLYKKSKTRDELIDFIKDNISDTWIKENYGEYLDKIEEMEKDNLPREKLRAYLTNKGFIIRPDWSAQRNLEIYSQEINDSLQYLEGREFEEKEIELVKIDSLKNQMKDLSIEQQKNLLKEHNIPLIRPNNPNFKDELFVNYIIEDYLNSFFEKDDYGEPTENFSYPGVAEVLKNAELLKLKEIQDSGKMFGIEDLPIYTRSIPNLKLDYYYNEMFKLDYLIDDLIGDKKRIIFDNQVYTKTNIKEKVNNYVSIFNDPTISSEKKDRLLFYLMELNTSIKLSFEIYNQLHPMNKKESKDFQTIPLIRILNISDKPIDEIEWELDHLLSLDEFLKFSIAETNSINEILRDEFDVKLVRFREENPNATQDDLWDFIFAEQDQISLFSFEKDLNFIKIRHDNVLSHAKINPKDSKDYFKRLDHLIQLIHNNLKSLKEKNFTEFVDVMKDIPSIFEVPVMESLEKFYQRTIS